MDTNLVMPSFAKKEANPAAMLMSMLNIGPAKHAVRAVLEWPRCMHKQHRQ